SGTGEQVDAHPTEELPFRFGDVRVTGPDYHIYRCDALCAKRHSCYGLHSAECVDFIGSAQMHGGDDRGMWFTAKWWRRSDDPLHARRLCCDHAHVSGRDHRISTAWHVATNTVHGDVLVSQDHARQRFNFHVLQRGTLRQSEVANLTLGKLDVL